MDDKSETVEPGNTVLGRFNNFVVSYFNRSSSQNLLPEGTKIEGGGELWPATYVVLHELSGRGVSLPRIEAHNNREKDGADLIWYEYMPNSVSKGSYYGISCPNSNTVVVSDVDFLNNDGPKIKESIEYFDPEMAEFEMIASYVEVSANAALRGEGSYTGFNARHPDRNKNTTD